MGASTHKQQSHLRQGRGGPAVGVHLPLQRQTLHLFQKGQHGGACRAGHGGDGLWGHCMRWSSADACIAAMQQHMRGRQGSRPTHTLLLARQPKQQLTLRCQGRRLLFKGSRWHLPLCGEHQTSIFSERHVSESLPAACLPAWLPAPPSPRDAMPGRCPGSRS